MSNTTEATQVCERRSYVSPKVTHLGQWTALTLLLSVPVGPGNPRTMLPGGLFGAVDSSS